MTERKFTNQEYYDSCKINNNHYDLQNSLYNIKDRDHALIVYSSIMELREIYTSFAKHALIDNNEIVIILYHYDSLYNIRYYLEDIGIDTGRYEKEGSLLIMDSDEPIFFSKVKDIDIDDSLIVEKLMLEKAKQNGKSGVYVIADMGSFFYKGDSRQNKGLLLAFETAIPRRFEENIKRLCLYHKDTLNRISNDDKDLLYKSHLQCLVFHEDN